MGVITHCIYLIVITLTRKDEKGKLKILSIGDYAEKEAISLFWLLLAITLAVSIIFWPVWLIKSVIKVFTEQ